MEKGYYSGVKNGTVKTLQKSQSTIKMEKGYYVVSFEEAKLLAECRNPQ